MTANKLAISVIATALISGCSILPFGKTPDVKVVKEPVRIEIIQPSLPRELDLGVPKWYVVSEAKITNPCIKRLQDDGSMKRPKSCLPEDRENPDWPEGYTYLDKFMDDIKVANGGDVLFVATTISDYELMSGNVQELRRYIRELGEVIVYYRNVTMPDGEEAVGIALKKNETDTDQ
tara:strand:- start:60 stop:590 length:531 start_codon:yes stop_codon:yes gene_type:complete